MLLLFSQSAFKLVSPFCIFCSARSHNPTYLHGNRACLRASGAEGSLQQVWAQHVRACGATVAVAPVEPSGSALCVNAPLWVMTGVWALSAAQPTLRLRMISVTAAMHFGLTNLAHFSFMRAKLIRGAGVMPSTPSNRAVHAHLISVNAACSLGQPPVEQEEELLWESGNCFFLLQRSGGHAAMHTDRIKPVAQSSQRRNRARAWHPNGVSWLNCYQHTGSNHVKPLHYLNADMLRLKLTLQHQKLAYCFSSYSAQQTHTCIISITLAPDHALPYEP